MTKNPDKITQMMKDLGCNGKRVTKELIESRIEEVDYQTVVIAGQKMMFCGIKLAGGFVQVGKPAVCIDPSNWRDEIGKQISYDNAFEDLWKLEAYHMTYQVGGDHLDRVKAEALELAERTDKLRTFINSDNFKNIDVSQQKLLEEQFENMVKLLSVLNERLK